MTRISWIVIVVIAIASAAGCGKDENPGGFQKKEKTSEARLNLDRISKAAKMAFATDGKFPSGTAGPTPAPTCCGTGNVSKCPPDPAAWQDPVWDALSFSMDDPHHFTYSYTSTGDTVEARAIGDLDCDGETVEWKLSGTVVDGNPSFALIDPGKSD
jgi:hypothetical protein